MNTSLGNITDRVSAIHWGEYHNPCWPTEPGVPKAIISIFSEDDEVALNGAYKLFEFAAQCVGSSSVPVLEFVVERVKLPISNKLLEELLDITSHYCVAAAWNHPKYDKRRKPDSKYENWQRKLGSQILAEKDLFEQFSRHENEDIRDWGEMILEELPRIQYCQNLDE